MLNGLILGSDRQANVSRLSKATSAATQLLPHNERWKLWRTEISAKNSGTLDCSYCLLTQTGDFAVYFGSVQPEWHLQPPTKPWRLIPNRPSVGRWLTYAGEINLWIEKIGKGLEKLCMLYHLLSAASRESPKPRKMIWMFSAFICYIMGPIWWTIQE